MDKALWIWRQFPRQIASDLRLRGLHIKHWLRGTRGADGDYILSSYELLEILEFLPEESAFKTHAERGGRWPRWWQMLAENTNEQYRFRSSWLGSKVEGGLFDTKDLEFIDPVNEAIRQVREEAEKQASQKSQGGFDAALGYS